MDLDAMPLLADLLRCDRQDLEISIPEPVRYVGHAKTDLDAGAGAWFQAGHPAMVLLAFGPDGVTIAEPEVTWHVQTPVLGARSSRRFDHPVDRGALWDEVGAVSAARRARFETCVDCREHLPPEWLGDVDGETVCHGCMTRNHGIVF